MQTQTTSVDKLLLNSWSAEYALRILPVVTDDEVYRQQSLTWTFPQVYYAALFSARALLVSTGYDVRNERNILDQMSVRASGGLYGADQGFMRNSFRRVSQYRISSQQPGFPATLPTRVEHEQLIELIDFIQFCHERQIIAQIGKDAYSELMAGLPSYLLTPTLLDRFTRLTSLPQ